MNENLHILLDKLTVAPTEVKSEIIAILVIEGSFPTKGIPSKLASLAIRAFCKIGGRSLMLEVSKKHMNADPDRTDHVFFELLDELTQRESLSLIQDLLYAVNLSKWKYNPNDAEKYLDKMLRQ